MKKIFIMIMAIMTACCLMAGCGGKEEKKAAAPAQKVLRVGTEPSFAPFEFAKEGSKELIGYDIDLINAVGKRMGYKVEISSMGFDGLIPAIQAGNLDVAISGFTITEERKKAIDFSDSYYTSGLTILVNKDNNSIKSLSDLEGKKVGCQIGTTGEMKSRTIKNAKVVAFNANTEAIMELRNKGVDAVINDAPVNDYFLNQGGSKDCKVVGEKMEAEEYGIVMKKGSKLVAEVNKTLADMKKDGEFDKIYSKWFKK